MSCKLDYTFIFFTFILDFTQGGLFMQQQCFSTNLRKLMKINNVTQDRLAEIADVTRQSVNQWLNKETLPTLQSVLLIAKHFEISVEQLVYCTAENITSFSIPRRFFPICTGIQDGKLRLERNWGESYMISNNIPVDADFCFIMYDNSMYHSRIRKGDIVVIKDNPNPKSNELALCILNNKLVFRRYYIAEDGTTMLLASNTDYPNYVIDDNSDFKVLGTATVFRGRL